jgi:GxxExxY protein
MKSEFEPHPNIDISKFKYGDLTQKIIKVFFEVYNELGHGFLESVYSKSLEFALTSIGLVAKRKIEIPVFFRGQNVGIFEADMLINDCILLELKAVQSLNAAHTAQLLNYLRATPIEVGLLFNFGLKPEFKRLIFDNPRKSIRANPCLSVADLLRSD